MVRFGLFSDLHMDIMHDGERRLRTFLSECDKESVDFIINNGDFSYPTDTSVSHCSEKNRPENIVNAMLTPSPSPKMEMLGLFNSYHKPHYHVLGNHEMDFCSKESVMKIYGMKTTHYDFHSNGWHFIVLDPNFYKDENGICRDYSYGDYFDHRDTLPYLPDEELSWLKSVILNSDEKSVIFSHQPLFRFRKEGSGIRNHEEFSKLVREINGLFPGRIRLCIYGHVHLDDLSVHDGVMHYSINSMSNHWVGSEFEEKRFDDETERTYPNLRYTFPYTEPLFAIVTLDDEGFTVKGRTGEFFRPTPDDIGFDKYIVSASVRDRHIPWSDVENVGEQ